MTPDPEEEKKMDTMVLRNPLDQRTCKKPTTFNQIQYLLLTLIFHLGNNKKKKVLDHFCVKHFFIEIP